MGGPAQGWISGIEKVGEKYGDKKSRKSYEQYGNGEDGRERE